MRRTVLTLWLVTGCQGSNGEGVAGTCLAGDGIQAALDAAGGGEVLEICGGTQTGPFVVGVDVELMSSEGGVLDGGGAAPVLTVTSGVRLVLRGLTVRNGLDRAAPAGGIDAGAAAALTLDGCEVRDNEGQTGGIVGPATDFRVVDTRVVSNVGETGGITMGAALLEGVTVSGNTGTFYGGGVQVLGDGSVTADAATRIEGNHSDAYGGGVFLWEGTTWSGAEVGRNTAVVSGGGVTLWAPRDVRLEEVQITDNGTPGHGGGLSVVPQVGGQVVLAGVAIRGNNAARGGGMQLLPGDYQVTLQASTVDGNAAGYAGGIDLGTAGAGMPPLILEGSSLTNNTAQYGGGMVLAASSEARFLQSTVTGNVASVQAGAVRVEAGVLVSEGSTWADNAPLDFWVNGVDVSAGTSTTFACVAGQQQCL